MLQRALACTFPDIALTGKMFVSDGGGIVKHPEDVINIVAVHLNNITTRDKR